MLEYFIAVIATIIYATNKTRRSNYDDDNKSGKDIVDNNKND
jgi:hypothetical protein